MSQRALAKSSGLGEAFLSKLFGGGKSLTMSEAFALCAALGLDPAAVVREASAAAVELPADIRVRLDAMPADAREVALGAYLASVARREGGAGKVAQP